MPYAGPNRPDLVAVRWELILNGVLINVERKLFGYNLSLISPSFLSIRDRQAVPLCDCLVPEP